MKKFSTQLVFVLLVIMTHSTNRHVQLCHLVIYVVYPSFVFSFLEHWTVLSLYNLNFHVNILKYNFRTFAGPSKCRCFEKYVSVELELATRIYVCMS